jgi:mannose/fructose/N-acetylgalactosamine-specific phosphotransferase system component IIB
MSENKDKEKKGFTSIVKPPETKEEELKIDTKSSIESAQDKLFGGLTQEQAAITLDNMKKLAPLDTFNIGGKDYQRQKITPKNLRKLKQAEKEYLESLKAEPVNADDRIEADFKLLQMKAEIYFGMTKKDFEDTDIEMLKVCLEATELRTQGFRRVQ